MGESERAYWRHEAELEAESWLAREAGAERDALRAQRDELLAACEAVALYHEDWPDGESTMVDMVRAAIRKAKEAQ